MLNCWITGTHRAHAASRRSTASAGLMLRDPQEAAWHWQTSKTEHSAASSSAGGFGGGLDARVPQRGDAVCAADRDVVGLTLKNDVRKRSGTCWRQCCPPSPVRMAVSGELRIWASWPRRLLG
jgi:hypothetical protein